MKGDCKMNTIVKEVRYGEFDKGKLYCVKDENLYVFCLSNFSWSLEVENEKQLEDFMRLENNFQGFKENLMAEMKDMLRNQKKE